MKPQSENPSGNTNNPDGLRRWIIGTIGAGIVSLAFYDLLSLPTNRDIWEKEQGTEEFEARKRNVAKKVAPELLTIREELETAEHTGNRETLQSLLKRGEVVIRELLANGAPSEETTEARMLAARTCALLGEIERAAAYYDDAMTYASSGELAQDAKEARDELLARRQR